MKNELVEQAYWDTGYARCVLDLAPTTDTVRRWIERHLPPARPGEIQTALEVGCFPGRYLAVFGNLGYLVNGIDRTQRVEKDLPDFLRAKGCRTGEFVRGDFLTHNFAAQYDLVASFGFIEHFSEWESVLLKQAALVKPGGRLMVTTPNFRGAGQRLLHTLVDRDNLHRHNRDAMQTNNWKLLIEAAGFEVPFCGCFGGFEFWVDQQARNVFQRATLALIERCVPLLAKTLTRNRNIYSPYCGLVARKHAQTGSLNQGGRR